MRFLRKDRYFYGLIILLAVLLGQLPILIHIFHTPAGFYYPYLDKVAFSDYYYIALTRYGMGSDWLLKIPYVTENHPGSIIQIFFLLLGKLSMILGVGPAEVIALTRVAGGVLYSVSVVLFLRLLLPRIQARFAFILFLMTEPFPTINFLKPISDWGFMNWIWHFGEGVRKISVMPPHYTIGKGLAVLSVYFLFIFLIKKHHFRYALVSGLLMVVTGIIYPPPVFILLVSILLTFSLFFTSLKNRFTAVAIFALCALLPLILLKIELAKGYPWNRWNEVELGWNTVLMNFEANYFLMLGLPVLFVPFALKRLVIDKEKIFEKVFLFIWFLSSFLLFPFANYLKLGKFRFTEGAQIVPQSILALWGFQYFLEYLKKNCGERFINHLRIVFIFIFVAYFFIYSSTSAYFSTWNLWGYHTNVYIIPEELRALKFMENNVPAGSIILADVYPSNFIPAFARVRTIIGFSDFYKDYDDYLNEQKTIQDILSNTVSEGEAEEYLNKRHVDYVYRQNIDSKSEGLYPGLMEEVFNNQKIAIYKVK